MNAGRRYLKWFEKIKPEFIFLVIATVFGVILTFRMVPLFGNDEIVHFPRAYYLQEGHLAAARLGQYDNGGYMPIQIKQFNDAYREQAQNDNTDGDKIWAAKQRFSHERLTNPQRQPLVFTSATLSAGWDYLPPAAGIFIARLLHLPLNWFVYLGRLSTLAVYILLTYFAIKYIPIGKRFLLVVALLPTALVQGATIGMDGLVNGLSWLLIALTFAALVKKITVTPKLLALMAFLALYLATTKQGYIALAALPLLLPARLFPFNLKRAWLWRVAFASVVLLVSLWYLQNTAHIASVIHYAQRPGLRVDEAAQLDHIFQKPLEFLSMIFIQPFTVWSGNVYLGIVGIVTNKLVKLPVAIILLLYGLLLVTVLHRERAHVNGRDQLYVLVSSVSAFLATFTLINLALYLSFTRVGYNHVEGLQGRYFLPLLPLLGILLHTAMPRLFLKISDTLMDVITYPGLILGLLVTATAIH